jgi:alpha-N-arabinofuranosidase
VTPTDRRWDIADLSPFQVLDVSASRDTERDTLVIGVVNRHATDAVQTTLELGAPNSDGGQVFEVNGPDVSSTNSFVQPDVVAIRKRPLEASSGSFTYSFPAHSVTVMRIPLRS